MTPILTHASTATVDEIEQYMRGECHVLALALHRRLGWNLEVCLDEGEPFWEDESDPDNFISSVLHVYAVDSQDRAWDVKGVRPLDRVREEMEETFSPQLFSSEEMRNESELTMYVGCWGDEEEIDRPLWEYSEQDIEDAWVLAQRIFKCVPEFVEACQACLGTMDQTNIKGSCTTRPKF